MMFDLEYCNRELAKCRRRIDRELLTEQQSAYRVIDLCLLVLERHPHEWPGFSAAVDTLPTPVLAAAFTILDATRLPEGGWRLPTIGGMHSSNEFWAAGPDEAATLEALSAWLRDRASQGPRKATEPGDTPAPNM